LNRNSSQSFAIARVEHGDVSWSFEKKSNYYCYSQSSVFYRKLMKFEKKMTDENPNCLCVCLGMGMHASRLQYHGQGMTTGKPSRYDGVLFRDNESQGRGKVEITNDDIVFQQKSKPALVWPIRSIRRYGCENDAFSFESGRRCDTGPGFYTFQTKHADEIFASVQETVVQIAQADRCARVVVPNPYTPPRPGPRYDSQLGNQYLNCDRQGRVIQCNFVDGLGLGSEDMLPHGQAPEKPAVEYADLDLSVLDRSSAGLRTPPRGLVMPSDGSFLLPIRDVSPHTLGMAKSKSLGIPVQDLRVDGTVYVTIDPTKSIAAANLARSFT
jgi:hypothetical protein